MTPTPYPIAKLSETRFRPRRTHSFPFTTDYSRSVPSSFYFSYGEGPPLHVRTMLNNLCAICIPFKVAATWYLVSHSSAREWEKIREVPTTVLANENITTPINCKHLPLLFSTPNASSPVISSSTRSKCTKSWFSSAELPWMLADWTRMMGGIW